MLAAIVILQQVVGFREHQQAVEAGPLYLLQQDGLAVAVAVAHVIPGHEADQDFLQ